MTTRAGVGAPMGADLAKLMAARVARLATVRPVGTPHVVAVTFAVAGDTVVTAIDSKPKRTTQLQRLRNLRANPAVSLLVDDYDDDWTQLWWLRIDGQADIIDAADGAHELDALVEKYPQYRDARPDGPLIVIRPDRWTAWTAN